MKKLFTLILAVLATSALMAQAIQRNKVIVETSTGTWCVWCPGAANGVDDLLTNGSQVAIIEYHNGDAYTNAASNARNSYYGVTGYPTANFDGVTPFVGGAQCPSGTNYSNYLPLYNSAYSVQAPMTIDVSGTNVGNTYNIVLSIHKLATISGTDLRAQVVLTETNITCPAWPPSGQCLTQVHFVERLMAPDENGTAFNFSTGDMQIITTSFTKDAAWVAANCEIVVFVQDHPSKTIYNGVKVPLNSLPAPISVNFTGSPTTGCTPVTTTFTDQSASVQAWQWSCPGGTPSNPSTQNPVVTYNAGGTYDVTLTAWNTTTFRGNKMVKPAYISVNSGPSAPGQPQGNSGMCSNPGSQTYTTTGSAGATSYAWNLTPPTAGTLTNNGTSCVIAWGAAFTGSATLTVQGINSCGTGALSPPLNITISQQPTKAGTPTGPTQLCIAPSPTSYTTSGSTPATSYVWNLVPPTAGTMNQSWTNCTITWNTSFIGTAVLTVSAMNNACQGIWSDPLNITVSNLPSVYTVTGGGVYCAQGGTGIAVGLSGSQNGVNYTLYLNGTATSTMVPGTGGAISFGNQMTAGNYTVEGLDPATTCSNNMNGTAVVAIDQQVPNTPQDPTGPTTVHSGSTPTSDYTTAGSTYATMYTWNLSPANAGNVNGTGSTGTVTWSNTFIGTAKIKVQGVNSCGGGSFSNELSVAVDNSVGIVQHTNQKLVSIYPNPAKNSIFIVPARTLKADIKIINSLGSVVADQKSVTLDGLYKLDISQLNPGVYFISINGNDVQEMQKIVVE